MGNCCSTEREQHEDNFNLREVENPDIIANRFKNAVNVKSDTESVGKLNGLAFVKFN